MRSETKKITAFLIAIVIVLLFSFTGADKIRNVTFQRTTEDVLNELRLELAGYTSLIFDLKQENILLRTLLHEDKGNLYALWDVFRDLPLWKD